MWHVGCVHATRRFLLEAYALPCRMHRHASFMQVSPWVQPPLPPSLPCRRCRFYDETKVGDVSSRLSADCQKVGDQVELNVNVALRSVIQVPRRRWRALQLCISLATYE